MGIRFSFVILSITALLGGIIYGLHLLGLVTPANEVYARFSALGLFIAGFVLLGWQKARHHRFSKDDFFKNNTLIIIFLTILLVSILLKPQVGYYTIGFFVGISFLHSLYSQKFYPPPTFFYFVILYALLLLFGTIGTENGFHFPDKILSFYLLPLSLCFFRLPQKTILRIGAIFFKMGIVFLTLCLLYWWFNFLFLDANLNDWIGGKTSYLAQMTGWERQAKIMDRFVLETIGWENIASYPARFFVLSWSYFYHPSFVSLVLFFGLITGFYLYHKKPLLSTVSKWELILYILLFFSVIMLMQSRIGLVGLLFIIAATGIYCLKLKTKYFSAGLAIYFLLGGAGFCVLKDKISGFTNDEIRNVYRQIAVSYIQDHFWWGDGYGQQHSALKKEAENIKENLPQWIYPHSPTRISYTCNQFLGNMVQYGIWGLLALVLLLGAIAHYAIKNRSYLLQMMTGVLILFMMIEEPLYVLQGIVPVLTFLIFFTAISESEKQLKNNE